MTFLEIKLVVKVKTYSLILFFEKLFISLAVCTVLYTQIGKKTIFYYFTSIFKNNPKCYVFFYAFTRLKKVFAIFYEFLASNQ